MKITERREVTHVTVDEVIIGRKCDICSAEIKKERYGKYNYFCIHTWHHDWGNDSVDSHEYEDACSPECVMKFTEQYIKDAHGSESIEIKHVKALEEGACETW